MLASRAISFSGDGAPAGKYKNFLNISISLPDERTPHRRAPQLIAMSTDKEEYSALADILGEINREVNCIQENGLFIDDQRVSFTFFLCADYKFLLTVCGMKSANSNNACLFCLACKAEYCKDGAQRRDRFNIGQPGVIKQCLLPSIPVERIIIDVLHMFLRTTDKLFLLIRRSVPDCRANAFVELLKMQIPCRGKLTVHDGKVEFQSLDSSDRERLLNFFIRSDVLVKFLGKPEGLKIRVLLAKLVKVLDLFRSSDDPLLLKQECDVFMAMFLRVFQSGHVTPYIHLMVFHGHEIVSRVGCMNVFTQQHVEKLNHNATVSFFSTTNFKGGVQQVMQQHGRRLLQNFDNV